MPACSDVSFGTAVAAPVAGAAADIAADARAVALAHQPQQQLFSG